MGRKPVFGLVGACLTSVAFMGCCDNCSLWDKSPKKDASVTSTTGSTRSTGSDNGWRQQPAVGSQGGGAFNNTTTAGSSGGTGAYGGSAITPGGNSPYPGGSGAVDRSSSGGTSGTDTTGGRSTQPVNYKDAGSINPVVRPGPSTLPPIPQGNAALPRTDDLTTGKSVRGPVIDPPAVPSSGTLPAVPATSTSGTGLPAVPAVSGAAPATADGLPPIPTPTSQQGLDRGPLPPPAPPPVSGSGVPTLPQNPATMPN
jgi:hypothetical protein